MSPLSRARHEGPGELLLTGGLLLAYLSLRGTGRALAALQVIVR